MKTYNNIYIIYFMHHIIHAFANDKWRKQQCDFLDREIFPSTQSITRARVPN